MHWRVKFVPFALLLVGAVAGAQLDLPTRPDAPPPAPGPARAKKGESSQAVPLDLPGPSSVLPPANPATPPEAVAPPDEGARVLFRELGALRDARAAAPLIERVLALGPGAVPVARSELGSNRAAVLLAAGRACLGAGTSADRAAVAERLTRALPPEVAAPLLDELLVRDPMLASPDYLVALLEHPTAALRTRAAQALAAQLTPATLAALGPALASQSTAAREAALDLVGRVSDPLAWNLLASRLGDPSARLAQSAASQLAGIDPAEPLLLERAFPAERVPGPLEWDRARAYALLALVEREEMKRSVLLDASRAESLLGGLSSPRPLVAGACAIALARIGFRCPASGGSTWLDREVPHQLVRVGTGAEFHADFSALERPALRALGLLSGESFGPDGEAWRRWWLEHAADFRARRAVIALAPDASAQLAVSFVDERGRGTTLLGPARAAPPGGGRVLRLDADAAERLLARLEAAGVFGIAHLPDPRTSKGAREFVVAVGDQEKRFDPEAGWVGELREPLLDLARLNLWQLCFDPATTSAEAWWRSEQARFAGLAPLERQREVKRLLIDALRRARGAARDEWLADLRQLNDELGVPEAADFEPLLAVLASESNFEPRGAVLCELARVAAAGAGAERAEPAARERLLALALERFGPEADASLVGVARDLEPAALRALAVDARPRARALAPEGLLRTGAEPEILRGLLLDPEPAVRLAMLAALGEAPREELRATLLECARSGASELRPLALRALVPLGGKDVRDAALEAVGDPDPEVQLAGVTALADLADEGSASLFASLLARGPGSPLHAAARRGLERLGPAGVEECLRLARSAGTRARREAALLLARAFAPEAAGLLLTILSEDPRDERVAFELSVLAGQDFTGEEQPERAAWAWWDLVVHDDPLAWFLAAAERAGVPAPSDEALRGAGSREGAQFLLSVAALPDPPLVERAVRELERLLGHEFTRPTSERGRAEFASELAEAVRARFGG